MANPENDVNRREALLAASGLAAAGVAAGPAQAGTGKGKGRSRGEDLVARTGRKQAVSGSKGMVVTSHPLATRAAINVLKDGGNACDAALAAAAMQLIVEPHMTALTGGLSMLYREHASGKAGYINGNVNAPLAPLPGYSGADLTTGRGVPVPGWWPAFEAAREKWGTRSRAQLLNPAIEVAREGFEINSWLYRSIAACAGMIGIHEQGREMFYPDGYLVNPGDLLKQERAGRTLERLRDEGMDYYLRDFADAFSRECQSGGGVITPEDFQAYRPMVQRPVEGTYRGARIIGSPAPDDGGQQLIEAFNLLELIDLKRLGPPTESFETLSHLIRVHNEVYYAPPRQGDLDSAPKPIEILLSKEYARMRFELMSMYEPRSTAPTPTPGTIHISVVDGQRNVASVTHSHMASPWVNGLFAEGFQLSGGGSFFQRILPQPGSRATVYLAPNIVLRGNDPVIVSGSPSVSLVACVLQNLVNLLDFGMTVEQSVHAPRFGTRPHSPERGWEPGTTLECGFSPAIQKEFVAWARKRRLWHRLTQPWNTLTGNFEGIALDPASGRMSSCADPRRVGAAEAL